MTRRTPTVTQLALLQQQVLKGVLRAWNAPGAQDPQELLTLPLIARWTNRAIEASPDIEGQLSPGQILTLLRAMRIEMRRVGGVWAVFAWDEARMQRLIDAYHLRGFYEALKNQD